MGTRQDFTNMTMGLGVEDDCPLCGYNWPGCQGACVQHETVAGCVGPFHTEFNDDCEHCRREFPEMFAPDLGGEG